MDARTIEWRIIGKLTAEQIEKWIEALPTSTTRVIIKIGAWVSNGPYAAARLQGALCLLHRKGIEVTAHVPPNTLTGKRADAAFATPNSKAPAPSLTRSESKLACSLAGLVVGQLCKFESSSVHIPDLQLRHLHERRYLFGWGPERALAVPVDIDQIGHPRGSALIRESVFDIRLQDLLGPFGVSKLNFQVQKLEFCVCEWAFRGICDR